MKSGFDVWKPRNVLVNNGKGREIDQPKGETKEDIVSDPSHYKHGGMETIDEMILVFGRGVVADFCLCNAWKYRARAIYKNGEEDMEKSYWYMNKYKELEEAMHENQSKKVSGY